MLIYGKSLRTCNNFINSNNINEILKKNCDFNVDVSV